MLRTIYQQSRSIIMMVPIIRRNKSTRREQQQQQQIVVGNNQNKQQRRTPLLSSVLKWLFPFLACCWILLTTFILLIRPPLPPLLQQQMYSDQWITAINMTKMDDTSIANNNNTNAFLNGIMQLIFQSSTNCDTSSATPPLSTSNKQQQNGPAVTSSIATSTTDNDSCRKEYERITADRLPGLTKEDLLRSITYSGNRHRLAILANKLGMMNMNRRNHNEKAVTVTTTQPVRAIVCGGSITLGHGVKSTLTYSSRLERWLNDNFPVTMTMPSTMIDANNNTSASSSPPRQRSKHSVQNMGSHGADICAFAKRTNQLLKVLEESNNSNNNDDIDLFILEFAVNDYQGQDHISMIQWRTDTFFEGFRDIAACTESVLVKLLHRYPNAAILFLEMRTAVVQRKTAAVLHMGAAQHYQIPVISYDQAVFPGYHHLLEKLRPFQYTHVANDTVMPYPQGCHRCRVEDIGKGVGTVCHSVCDYQNQRGVGYERLNCTDIPPGRLPCYVPFLAHDDGKFF